MEAFLSSPEFTWIILPLLVFLSRVCDVTFGTLRIIFVSRGNKTMAAFLGFFEVIIWLLAISQIMQHLDNFLCYIAYGGGFAMGNYIGITLEEKLAMGLLGVRVITNRDNTELRESLTKEGFGVTRIGAHGSTSEVDIIYMVIKRSALPKVETIIKQFNPKAFYSIEDVRTANSGVFPTGMFSTPGSFGYFRRFAKRK